MVKVYNAGPLFNEAERKQRLYEGKRLREEGFEVFNPLEEMNFDMGPAYGFQIFDLDYAAMKEADYFFFDLSTDDTGTMVELGMVLQMLMDGKDIQIFPIISDSREQVTGAFKSFESPKGWNKFMIGALKELMIYKNFDSALESALDVRDMGIK